MHRAGAALRGARVGHAGTWDSYGGGTAYRLWDAAAALPQPLLRFGNGGSTPPQVGDIIIFGATGGDPTGHTGVISAVGDSSVTIVEQNGDPHGQESVWRSGTTLSWRLPVIGWLRAPAPPPPPASPPAWPRHVR